MKKFKEILTEAKEKKFNLFAVSSKGNDLIDRIANLYDAYNNGKLTKNSADANISKHALTLFQLLDSDNKKLYKILNWIEDNYNPSKKLTIINKKEHANKEMNWSLPGYMLKESDSEKENIFKFKDLLKKSLQKENISSEIKTNGNITVINTDASNSFIMKLIKRKDTEWVIHILESISSDNHIQVELSFNSSDEALLFLKDNIKLFVALNVELKSGELSKKTKSRFKNFKEIKHFNSK